MRHSFVSIQHSLGKCSGISFIDSTFSKYATTEESILIKYLKTLHNEEIKTGWFYGFKLHFHK
ncbi:transposase [Leptospira noguchii]|uniref:transposase n=1 Tax=Leptospira noguchii TaxID=28182 RepID=UPI0022A65D92|nr:transposase [Leptospira noguchii]